MNNNEKTDKKTSQQAVPKTNKEPCVYIGPDMPDAKQYTVFNNGLPESLKKKISEKPFLKSLVIPVNKLAQASAELNQEGSATDTLFKKALKEI